MICRCDLHIHTALSPCASPDMTPADIVNMAELKGLDAIAITDHQSCGNCACAMNQAAKGLHVTVIPGIEVNSADEIHMICLFPELETALDFGNYIYRNLVCRDNQPHLFGRQVYFDLDNNELGQENSLLLMPCRMTTQDILHMALEAGGACIPAHIDRNSYSMLATFGTIPPELPISWLEISNAGEPGIFRTSHPELNGFRLLQGSDAHQLADISEQGWPLEIAEANSKIEITGNIISALRPVSEQ